MARRPTPLDGRGTWRPALLGAGAGIAGCAFVSMTARLLLHRFQLNPYGPNAWLFGAVFVGILAAGVVFVLGIAPDSRAIVRRGRSALRNLARFHLGDASGAPASSRNLRAGDLTSRHPTRRRSRIASAGDHTAPTPADNAASAPRPHRRRAFRAR